jgi:hydratase-aldolase
MYTPDELRDLMVMMPAFATEDAASITATNTIHLDNLRDGVNRMIADGASIVVTTGTSGECHALLYDEFQTLVRATLEVVNQRVPVFIGVTSPNSREAYQKAKWAQSVGAEGISVGVPYYEASTVANCIRFYKDLAEALPDLAIAIYHNPVNHHIHIPVAAFTDISKNRNIVAMKDSHRTPLEFLRLQEIIGGKIAHFVNQAQLYPYYEMGAAGCWSFDAFMGPWPQLALLKAVKQGDKAAAKAITKDITGVGGGGRDGGATDRASKLLLRFAGYVDAGPNRPPFLEYEPGSVERVRKRAEHWKTIAAKYREQLAAVPA